MVDLILIVVIIVALVAWAAIIRKAGYSPAWILVAFVPVVNFLLLLAFAFGDWPILRELRFQTITEKTVNPKDGEKFLRDALKFELRGDSAEALLRYAKIQRFFAGNPVAEDARVSIEALRNKISQPAA